MTVSRPDFVRLLKRMTAGEYLSAAECADAVGAMMAGEAAEIQTASFLSLLALKLVG